MKKVTSRSTLKKSLLEDDFTGRVVIALSVGFFISFVEVEEVFIIIVVCSVDVVKSSGTLEYKIASI